MQHWLYFDADTAGPDFAPVEWKFDGANSRVRFGDKAESSLKTIANPVDFGTAEGNLICADGELRLTGIVSGSNGITVSGTLVGGSQNSLVDVVTLAGGNTFTGPITINSGKLRVEPPGSLGAGTGEIVLNDGILEFASASPTGLPAYTLSRPVRLNGYQGTISSYSVDQFVMAQAARGMSVATINRGLGAVQAL